MYGQKQHHTERYKIQMSYNKYEIMEAKINKNPEGDQIILKKIGLKKPSIHEILIQINNDVKSIKTDVSDLKVRMTRVENRLDKQDEFNSQVLKRFDALDDKLARNNIN